MTAPTLTPTGIRTDIVTRLLGATGAGSAVYDSRRVGIGQSDIPAITVYSPGHQDTRKSLGGLLYDRKEQIGITAVVTGASDAALAAAVDTIERQIVNVLLTDMEWNAVVLLTQVGCEKELSLEGAKRVGYVVLSFEVAYMPDYTVDLTGLAFERISLDTQTADPEGADVSLRITELEQE